MDPDLEDVQTVRIGPAFGRVAWRVGAIVVVFLLGVLVGKPWALGEPGARPSDTTGIGPTLRPPDENDYFMQGSRPYDPALFGRYEAQPRWEIWPAGYIVEMGFAGPLAVGSSPAPAPSAAPPASPGSSAPATPAATTGPTPPPKATELLDLGRAENLGVVGVNTPQGLRVIGIMLWRFDGDTSEAVDVIELEPPWGDDHFHVYGIAPGTDPQFLGVWLPSVYRLDLTVIDAGGSSTDVHIGLLVRDVP